MDFKSFVIVSLIQDLLYLSTSVDGSTMNGDQNDPFSYDYAIPDQKEKSKPSISCEPDGTRLKIILSTRCPDCEQPQSIFVIECNTNEKLRNRTLDKLDQETEFKDLNSGSYKILLQRDGLFMEKETCCQVKELDEPNNHTEVLVITIAGCSLLVTVLSITAFLTRNRLPFVDNQNDSGLDHNELLLNNFRESTISSYQVYV